VKKLGEWAIIRIIIGLQPPQSIRIGDINVSGFAAKNDEIGTGNKYCCVAAQV
jgi:hypothetical protein